MTRLFKRFGLLSALVAMGGAGIAAVALAAIVTGASATGFSSNVSYSVLTLSQPEAITMGDLLLANVSVKDGTSVAISAPSGWTLISRTDNGTDISVASYYKIASTSEPANYTWTFNTQTKAAGGITRYGGVDATHPIDVSLGSSGKGKTATAPSVTTTAANEQVVAIFAMDWGMTSGYFNAPSGMTENYDITNAPSGPSTAMDSGLQATTGASGQKISTINSPAKHNWAAQTIALRTAPPQSTLTNGLVSYWKLDETTGNSAADAIGRKTLIAVNSPFFDSGKIFNGMHLAHWSKQYLAISDATQTGLDITKDMTINGWIKLDSSLIGHHYGFVSKCDNSSRSWCFSFIDNDGLVDQFYATISNDGGAGIGGHLDLPTKFSTDVWYMVTVIYDSSNGTVSLYRDGTLLGTTGGFPNSIFDGTAEFRIGWSNAPSDYDGFDGVMDEIGIWNRKLSPIEIAALYNIGAGIQYPF